MVLSDRVFGFTAQASSHEVINAENLCHDHIQYNEIIAITATKLSLPLL